ncbi:DUF6335 family protein [Leptolyngbyaceae cyanobacterium UHCC 1019]
MNQNVDNSDNELLDNSEKLSDKQALQKTIDLPKEVTESYGTGVHDQSGTSSSGQPLRDRIEDFDESDSMLTGIDVDAVGDESVGGTMPTPDMDIVDELGAAVGLEMDDRAFLRTNEILEARDDRRWELDPEVSEDYSDRSSDL